MNHLKRVNLFICFYMFFPCSWNNGTSQTLVSSFCEFISAVYVIPEMFIVVF